MTPIDNLTNKNKNVFQNKKELNEKNDKSNLNVINLKIDKLKNEILKDNSSTNYNYQNKNKKTYYNYQNYTNNCNYNKDNIRNKEESNCIKINENTYNNDFKNNNYLTYELNNRINYTLNNDFELKENFISKCNNKGPLLKINDYNEKYWTNNNSQPLKDLLKSVFEKNSTNNFMKSFSPKIAVNRTFNNNYYFDYDNNNINKKKNHEIHNYFGIQMNGNRLDQLLKDIPKHKKESKMQKYNCFVLSKLNKDKKFDNGCFRNNKALFLKKTNTYNEEDLIQIMPANIITYN